MDGKMDDWGVRCTPILGNLYVIHIPSIYTLFFFALAGDRYFASSSAPRWHKRGAFVWPVAVCGCACRPQGDFNAP